MMYTLGSRFDTKSISVSIPCDEQGFDGAKRVRLGGIDLPDGLPQANQKDLEYLYQIYSKCEATKDFIIKNDVHIQASEITNTGTNKGKRTKGKFKQ